MEEAVITAPMEVSHLQRRSAVPVSLHVPAAGSPNKSVRVTSQRADLVMVGEEAREG
jgi:hypothetical protein